MYILIIGVYLYSSNNNAKPLGISKLVKHCHENHDNDRKQSLAEVEHRAKGGNWFQLDNIHYLNNNLLNKLKYR